MASFDRVAGIDEDEQFPTVVRERIAANLEDPATPEGEAVMGIVQSELLDGLTILRVTQEEYDDIPIPRPADVLYVITA